MISRTEQFGDCTFVAVSDRGINHQVNNVLNQDAVDFISSDNDFALVLSDGVGSCPKAEMGSKAAISAVKKVFLSIKELKLQLGLPDMANRIINEWKGLLSTDNLDEYCATLKVAMKFGDQLSLLSIGDGILAVSSGEFQCYSPMKEFSFINQTMCLNSAVKVADFWTYKFKMDSYMPYVIFVCSDGVANGIQEGCEMTLVSEIEKDISEENLQEELESLVLDLSKYTSDDRTLGVVKHGRKNAGFDR